MTSGMGPTSGPKKPNYKSLQKAITRDDKRGVEARWEYGRAILTDPKKMAASGKSLRHGAMEALIADAKAVCAKLTEREIQYRIQCARTYKSINEIRTAMVGFETWSDLRDAGFPAVVIDEELSIDEALADILPAETDWEQLALIPGLKPVLKVNGKKIAQADALVADGEAYEQMVIEMSESVSKTAIHVQEIMRIARLGADGDRGMRLVEAYQRGLEVAP